MNTYLVKLGVVVVLFLVSSAVVAKDKEQDKGQCKASEKISVKVTKAEKENTPAKAKKVKRLLADVNKDLELEYSAVIQYIDHAAVVRGAASRDIIKELKIHANEEVQHAMILADQIGLLGGSPSVKVGKIHTSKDNGEMLQWDIDGEEDAIRRYTVRAEQAEKLKEFALAQQLRNILATEQEHVMDLKKLKLALGK